MGQKLAGVFSILATPFDEQGQLDPESLRSLVRFQLDAGVHGFTILGIMGEVSKLSEAERQRVTEVVIDEVRGRVPVVVGTGHTGTDVTIALSRAAAQAGAAGVMIAPPYGLKNPEAIVDFYRRIGDAVPVPIVVQDEPVTTGVLMPAALIARIVEEVERAIYVKLEEVPTTTKMTALRKLVKREAGLFGGVGGMYFLEELARGAAGIMTGFGYPEVLVRIYEDFRRGDRKQAADLFYRFTPLIRYEAQPGIGLAIRKELFRWRGAIRCAAVRSPGAALDETTRQELMALLEHLGLPQGLAV